MKSITRISIWVFWALLLNCVFAGYGRPQGSYVIFSQTTLNCILTGCTDAQFTPQASMSYGFNFRQMGQQNVAGFVTFNGTTFTDAVASMNWQGYGNHYPYGTWEVRATFDNGNGTMVEHFYCFRTCGTRSNHDGEIILTGAAADTLVGGGTGGGGH